jgi:cell division protein FtsI (penicillin-binding protein 3)
MTSSRSNNKPAPVAGSRSRFFLVRGLVVFLFTLLGARLVYVQGVLRDELHTKADRECAQRVEARIDRNEIVDRNHLVLAESSQIESCFVDPSQLKNARGTVRTLAAALNISESPLLAKIAKSPNTSFLWVKRNVPGSTVALIKAKKLPGVGFQSETRRHYPFGAVASHLLGLVGVDGHGLSGVERAFESTLNPKSCEPDAPRDLPIGQIQLTLDAKLQQICERELDWGARKTGAKRGLVLVQDPWSGDILGMASWPTLSLDPDVPPNPKELRIPAIADVFEPGSTFKIVTAAAAIEERAVSPSDRFDGEHGAWKVSTLTIHDHEPQGRMSLDDIIVHSSNIGTAKVGERLGADRLFQYARLFGFGVYTGCGVGGEAKGLLRTPSKWSGVSKYVVSFGQEVGVTAIQLIGAYSAVANGGVLMEPRIVHAVVSDSGKVLWEAKPARVRQVISHETATRLTDILAQVVERGTGMNAKLNWTKTIRVAGKTGTAQKYDRVHHRYDDNLTLVSFCGFFPTENPKLTMLVILDEPEGRRFGGTDAAPIFRRIAEQALPLLDWSDRRTIARRDLPAGRQDRETTENRT